jgi:hypothetical protein
VNLGYGASATRGTFFSFIGQWNPVTTPPSLTLAPASATQKDLFTLSGASGKYLIIITFYSVVPATPFQPIFSWAGVLINPLHSHTISGVTEQMYIVDLRSTGVFRSSVFVSWTTGAQLGAGDLSVLELTGTLGLFPPIYASLRDHLVLSAQDAPPPGL